MKVAKRIEAAEREAGTILREAGFRGDASRETLRSLRGVNDRLLWAAFRVLEQCAFLRQYMERGDAEKCTELAWDVATNLANVRLLRDVSAYRESPRTPLPIDAGGHFGGMTLFPRLGIADDANRETQQQEHRSRGGANTRKYDPEIYRECLSKVRSEYPHWKIDAARQEVAERLGVSLRTVKTYT